MTEHKHAGFVRNLLRRKLRVPSHAREDVFAAGLLGLAEAERKFDPAKGIAFLAFARRYVLGRMIDHIRKELGRKRIARCQCGWSTTVMNHPCPNCGFHPNDPTPRELQAWEGAWKGLTDQQIAVDMGISAKGVSALLSSLRTRLGIHGANSRVALVRLAYERGLFVQKDQTQGAGV